MLAWQKEDYIELTNITLDRERNWGSVPRRRLQIEQEVYGITERFALFQQKKLPFLMLQL